MSHAIHMLSDDEYGRHLTHDQHASFGSLSTDRGHLPLAALSVHARVAGLLAETEVVQTFVNTSGEPVEATYIFPLPSRAAVTSFRFEVDGRVVEGVLKERGAARREYDAAVRAGHRAAITEEERPDVFTMRVGNLMPGDRARVRLTLAGPLPLVGGEATFRFPLVVAPRYIPGRPLGGGDVGDGTAHDTDAVPDASRISPPVLLPGYPNPVRLDLVVDLDETDLRVTDLRSSLHAVLVEGGPSGVRRLRVQPGERLNRDFVLRLSYATSGVTTGLVLCPDEARPDEGTFALTVVPPQPGTLRTKPRDIVFVLDRSGSMGGWKMVAARRAVGRMIDSLRDDDRFMVLAFDNVVERLEPGLTDATDRARYRAVEQLGKVSARGGTEMYQPLADALSSLAGGYHDRERVVVLITDGQVGNESQILKLLKEKARATRLFALGIDRAVNAGFLERMASLTGGGSELVESEDRLDAVLARIGRQIESPVLSGLHLAAEGVAIDDASVVPQRLPDLYAGAPITILGRYRGAPRGAIVLSAAEIDGGSYRQRVDGTVVSGRAAEKCWARGRVRDLEDRFDAGERHRAQEITALSLKHGVLCKFTSFVAVDRAVVVNAGGHQRQVTQPVESPDGWAMLGAGDSLEEAKSRAPREVAAGRAAPAPAPEGRPPMSLGAPPPPSRPAPTLSARSVAPLSRSEAQRESFDSFDDVPDTGAGALRGDDLDSSEGAALSEPPAPRAPRSKGIANAVVGAGWAVLDALRGGGGPGGGAGVLLARGAELLALFRALARATPDERRAALAALEPRLLGLVDELRRAGMSALELVAVEAVHRAVRDAAMQRELLFDDHAVALLRYVEDSLVAFASGGSPPMVPTLPPLVAAAGTGGQGVGAQGGGRRDGSFWR